MTKKVIKCTFAGGDNVMMLSLARGPFRACDDFEINFYIIKM